MISKERRKDKGIRRWLLEKNREEKRNLRDTEKCEGKEKTTEGKRQSEK